VQTEQCFVYVFIFLYECLHFFLLFYILFFQLLTFLSTFFTFFFYISFLFSVFSINGVKLKMIDSFTDNIYGWIKEEILCIVIKLSIFQLSRCTYIRALKQAKWNNKKKNHNNHEINNKNKKNTQSKIKIIFFCFLIKTKIERKDE